ncbi:hypothetical protein [Pseudactinotalea sp. Z1748]|uniref:hypothetical protein n=1 Tax=Pseudactinotalea sp. Z1748 TaxID=3413027 RepID=UPI003C7EB49D
MNTQATAIEDRLRAWAKGMYNLEAGTDLLIRFGKGVHEASPWIRTEGGRAWVDVDALIATSGAWSGGEQRIADIAVSLLSADHPVNLGDAVTGIDRQSTSLVLAAIAHANGSHQHSSTIVENGRFWTKPAASLYPWPEAD